MNYQLVLQFFGDSEVDLEAAVELEELLMEAVGDDADVDGHDIGAGQTNIFIFTSDPGATFEAAKVVLQEVNRLESVTAGYRNVDDDAWTVIWPIGSTTRFEML